jgi:hypothetical protein
MKKYLTAPDKAELRNKVAMIVFAIEEAIGTRLKTHSIPENIISETYFQELIEIACEEHKSTDLGEDYKELKKIFLNYRLSEIRNAVSHANRNIYDNYWFKMAAVASDPIIDKLELSEVKAALAAAVEGKITVPPAHWFINEDLLIPNTLPSDPDYSITGFVGRRYDTKELNSLIENKKISSVAIVGPGGTGKTALAMSVLDSLAHDHSVSSWCDGILYATAKINSLTVNGIIDIDAETNISEIIKNLKLQAEEIGCEEYFNEEYQNNSTKKLIVCIDNFESIALRNERAIYALNNQLPDRIKLLLTSRIPVDGVLTYPLQNMHEADALWLANKYAERSGAHNLSKETLDRIVKKLHNSPLAIKLSIDLYNRGMDESVATGKAINEVVDFSFTNLIERLSDLEIKILEVLFQVSKPCSTGDIVTILDEESETIIDSLVALSRTSLVIRSQKDSGDEYSIGDTVVTFIRKNNRHLQIRSHIGKQISSHSREVRQHESIQVGSNADAHNWCYINPSLPNGLKVVLIRAVKLIKANKTEYIGSWLELSEQLSDEFRRYSEYHYFYGLVLKFSGDINNSIQSFKYSLVLNPENIWARISLADAFIESQLFQEAYDVLSDPICAKSITLSIYIEREYWRKYYVALRRIENWDLLKERALIHLEDVNTSCKTTHLVSAAIAFYKSVTHIHTTEPNRALFNLIESGKLLKKFLDGNNLTRHLIPFCLSYIKEVTHFFSKNPSLAINGVNDLLSLTASIADKLFIKNLLLENNYNVCIHQLNSIIENMPMNSTPISSLRWINNTPIDEVCSDEIQNIIEVEGNIIAKIVATTQIDRGYTFGTCIKSSKSYFLHIRNSDLKRRDFYNIYMGQIVVLSPNEELYNGKLSAKHWTLLSSYKPTNN